jgi:CheY-like chemotaxis protein
MTLSSLNSISNPCKRAQTYISVYYAHTHRTFKQYVTVIEAQNGAEAMEMALKQPPNLVISDVMMPGTFEFRISKVNMDLHAM